MQKIEAGRLVPDLFVFFLLKALYEAKVSGLQLHLDSPPLGIQ